MAENSSTSPATGGNTTITGTAAVDTLSGGGGADTIFGGAGADRLSGDAPLTGQWQYSVYDRDFTSANTQTQFISSGTLVGNGYVDDFGVRALRNTLGGTAAANDRNDYGIIYRSNLAIGTTGTYTFSTTSDDGSRIIIRDAGGTIVFNLDNDFHQPATTRSASATLTAGQTYSIEVYFWENLGGDSLSATIAGPGFAATDLATSTLLTLPPLAPGHIDGNDSILGDAGDDTITGGGGDDRLYGGADNDSMLGEAGQDQIYGGDGVDRLFGGSEADLIYGGLLNDTIDGGTENDTLYGDEGDDSVLGDAGRDSIFGGVGDDRLYGGAENDTVAGDAGLDRIYGGDGADQLSGGADTDLIYGGLLNDTIDGGTENDTLYGDEGDDSVVGDTGRDALYGGVGSDRLYGGAENDTLTGDAGLDTLYGGDGADQLSGGDDADLLYGGIAADTLYGGAANDTLFGDVGNDFILGGVGADSLFGGADRDLFLFQDGNFAVGDSVDGGNAGDDVDILDLSGYGWARTDITYTTPDRQNGFVDFFSATGAYLGRMFFTEIEQVIPCFTAGTLIDTPTGPRSVESIPTGDLVLTLDDGAQTVRWVGHRRLGVADLLENPDFQPVTLEPGSLGPGLPDRTLVLSPQHRVLLSGARCELYTGEAEVLAPVLHLVGALGVRWSLEPVTYVHIMFDRHQIVRTHGIWSESFQPGAGAMQSMPDAQRDELFLLFPELAAKETYPAARVTLKSHETRILLHAGL